MEKGEEGVFLLPLKEYYCSFEIYAARVVLRRATIRYG